MHSPSGYRLEKSLKTTTRCETLLATREPDGHEVVLKVHLRETSSDLEGRAARELEALRAMPAGCAVRALELDRSGPHPVLVLEHFAGVAVERRLDPPAFLDFAVRCARALAGVHHARWVHGGIQPQNALMHPSSGELRLVGFTRAMPLGAPLEVQEQAALDTMRYYMAPEMSGRTDRGVDARSDLYALGATFYELLTGLTPFDSLDALELIHAHVARRPRSPLELRPDLPATLARIMLRLLEKEPEDRYQTADALAVDLESCREQLERTHRIDDAFPLGTSDAPYRPLFRRAVYGRDPELQTLLGAYRRAQQGQRELVLVAGAPGIGKSALMPELHRPLALDGGYLVQGKFDLYRRHLPYSGFVTVLQSLVDQIRSESDTRVKQWCDALLGGLGNLAAVMIGFIPDLALILGESAPPDPLGPRETQQRLALAVQRFMSAVAARARPLVLFLDDLQWADAGSLMLLEELLRASHDWPLLLVCAYRDGEVERTHAFARLLERVRAFEIPVHSLALAPISLAATTQMLTDALGRSGPEIAQLAEFVGRKSGHNPLLTQHCVHHLQRLEVIRFQRGLGWIWNDAEIAAANVPDDPLGMMMAKLERLSRAPRDVLALASCVGDRFDVAPLLELGHLDRGALEAALYLLSDDGLIAPAREGFRFVHDRVREAAQALLSAEERRSLHHRAGMLLLDQVEPALLEERCFEIADHLNRAHERLSIAERPRALAVNVSAGRRALAAGAAATAHTYFDAARALFRADDWNVNAAQAFTLHLESAEAAAQIGSVDLALGLLDSLEPRARGKLELAQVLAKRIYIVSQRSLDDGLELMLASLKRFGVHWPGRPSRLRLLFEVWRTDWILRGPLDERGFALRQSEDRTWMAPLLLIGAGGGTLGRRNLLCLATAYTLRMRRRHGAVAGMDYALSGYAFAHTSVLRSTTGATRYAEAAELWTQRLPDPVHSVRSEYQLQSFVHSWTRPRRTLLECFPRFKTVARELGDTEFSLYASWRYFSYAAITGVPLADVVAAYEKSREYERQLRGQASLPGPERAYSALRTPATPEQRRADLEAVEATLTRPADFADYRTSQSLHWVIVLGYLGEHELALALAAKIVPSFDTGLYGSTVADFTLFRGLAAVARALATRGLERRGWLRVARACARDLSDWARLGPDFAHMELFLQAELARARGHAALDVYPRAIERALAQGYPHHAALIHERRAALLLDAGRADEAADATRSAIELYERWGALAKVEQLRERIER